MVIDGYLFEAVSYETISSIIMTGGVIRSVMLTCDIGTPPEVEIFHPRAGLEDQPQAEVIQPLAVSEVKVSQAEAA